MDDSMNSVMNNEQAIELYHQLSDVWGKAAMYARKWLSNSTGVLNIIPPQDRVKSVNLETGHFPLSAGSHKNHAKLKIHSTSRLTDFDEIYFI